MCDCLICRLARHRSTITMAVQHENLNLLEEEVHLLAVMHHMDIL